jgi:diacylglycerol kinase (ATP)
VQVAIGVATVVLGVWLRLGALEWALVVLAAALVLACEVLNSAIEAVVDLASPEHHVLARDAKDAGAGATLIAAVASLLVGLLVFGPRLLALLR